MGKETMRVADWIADYLYQQGITRVHGLMGGGASGLNDGFIKHGKISYICYHHEQGAGHAAIGESKFTGRVSVVNPTTGCAGTNCATSVLNAWQDSVPVIFISGNVRLDSCSRHINKKKNLNIRKYGVQEHDVIETYRSITKAAFFVDNVKDVAYVLSTAIEIAQTGRPGPVWIDIPSDVQTAPMPEVAPVREVFISDETLHAGPDWSSIVSKLRKAQRPVILAGYGIRQSNTVDEFTRFVKNINVPFVSTYGARDYLPADHNLNIGTVGIKGSRAGNFALQNADLLLVLGSSLNGSVVGYNPAQFSPTSYKIVVDIDSDELDKNIVHIDHKVRTDLKDFFNFMLSKSVTTTGEPNWLARCLKWKNRWPVIQEEYLPKNMDQELNIYAVLDAINKNSSARDILMGDAGSISYAGPVALEAKQGQRLVFSPAQADMGWALPGAIGVALAADQPVISIIGDGSFMSNIQELAVARQHNLNIKFVILNNNGYLSIKNTQEKYYQGRVYGTSSETGLWFPNMSDIARAFDIPFVKINSKLGLETGFVKALTDQAGPVIIECVCRRDQEILPAQALKNGRQAGLHDMTPFLSDEELAREMIVKID